MRTKQAVIRQQRKRFSLNELSVKFSQFLRSLVDMEVSFDFITLFVSVIYGLAVTHALTCIAATFNVDHPWYMIGFLDVGILVFPAVSWFLDKCPFSVA